jgi:hypothetical protein
MPGADAVIEQLSALVRNPEASSPADEGNRFVSEGHVRFQVQFFGVAEDMTPLNLGVADLRASEAAAAMWEAIGMAWPTEAIGFRLLQVGGQGLDRTAS